MYKSLRNNFLCILDVIICLLWVSHLTVTYWRGTWNLVDVYILPEKPLISAVVTTLAGVVICAAFKLTMPVLNKYVTKENRILYTIVSRLVSYIMALGLVLQWRGVWYLLDMYMDRKWQSNSISLIVTLAVMCLLQSYVNVPNNPPLVIGYDERDNFFYSEGRFKIKASIPLLYVADICLYQFVIVSLVASAWRAVWNIYNDVILPDNFLYSNLASLFAGHLIAIILIVTQKPVALLSDKLNKHHWVLKLILHQVYILPAIAGNVSMWRGWWNITEGILLPDLVVGGWICHSIGVVGLTLTGMLSSLYDMQCITDGDFLEGHTFWQIKFLQLIFTGKDEETNTDKPSAGTVFNLDQKDGQTEYISIVNLNKDSNTPI